TFEDYSFLTNTPYPGKEIRRISAKSSYTSGHFEVSELAACLEKLHFPALLVMLKFSRICFSVKFKSVLHYESSL
ncbi:hypothetical protein Tco_0361695, partial [Tanacetum coccineum]